MNHQTLKNKKLLNNKFYLNYVLFCVFVFQLQLVERCSGDVKPVLVSLAMTYADIGDYDAALSYYEQELTHCHGNHQEVRTLKSLVEGNTKS